jgi:hypothetical protein
MLPNHYEVEEVSRIRRDEAVQQATHDRMRRDLKRHDDRVLTVERGSRPLGRLRRRLAVLFKRNERLPARSLTD